MILHNSSLVILSITIAILGAFTAAVMMSNIRGLKRGERGMRVAMASLALGGSIWATLFVGLLALAVPINFTHSPVFLGASAVTAFAGSAIALAQLTLEKGEREAMLPVAVAVLGMAIAATNYFGLISISGSGLHLSWFLTVICVAVSLQVAAIILFCLYRSRGVVITLAASTFLGLCIAAAHYLAIDSARDFEKTLLGVPRYSGGVSNHSLAWAAAIMIYLVCSICLCIFVIQQFRDELE